MMKADVSLSKYKYFITKYFIITHYNYVDDWLTQVHLNRCVYSLQLYNSNGSDVNAVDSHQHDLRLITDKTYMSHW